MFRDEWYSVTTSRSYFERKRNSRVLDKIFEEFGESLGGVTGKAMTGIIDRKGDRKKRRR